MTLEAIGDKKDKKMRRWLEIEEIEHTINRGSLLRRSITDNCYFLLIFFDIFCNGYTYFKNKNNDF